MYKTIIIGAGPAGLASGYYLARNNINTLILEKDCQVGGLSKTIVYKDARFDIGGHRFFTDNKEISSLWSNMLGEHFLKRRRLSRIYYNNKFFDYPLNFTNTFKNLGIAESILILLSYFHSRCVRSGSADNFEGYIVNNFGRRLFNIFFKSYTEKVWGVPCSDISADWARQRIKGLSMLSAITKSLAPGKNGSIRTLVKEFNYPVFGPGMMYEKIAESIIGMNGQISKGMQAVEFLHNNKKITRVVANDASGKAIEYPVEQLISSMPIDELIRGFEPAVPKSIMESAGKLRYRNFITVNLICAQASIFPDNWIYIHSPGVKLCRIQNYKNWSPAMFYGRDGATLGLEYFCSEDGYLWNESDEILARMAEEELQTIGFPVQVRDFFVYRAAKAYPVYDVDYKVHLNIIKDYLNNFSNLQLIGRAGRFRYDNMDVAMDSGIQAARRITK